MMLGYKKTLDTRSRWLYIYIQKGGDEMDKHADPMPKLSELVTVATYGDSPKAIGAEYLLTSSAGCYELRRMCDLEYWEYRSDREGIAMLKAVLANLRRQGYTIMWWTLW
jgi:hypothetical protein